ncbi:hypothetical protein GY45DRAFT_1171190 [Cubamyces sp. BRFM 1775]|nr:hypothetical protein GY45DRAFT_1171190 [Cubamyces sp. BRFM 1775]
MAAPRLTGVLLFAYLTVPPPPRSGSLLPRTVQFGFYHRLAAFVACGFSYTCCVISVCGVGVGVGVLLCNCPLLQMYNCVVSAVAVKQISMLLPYPDVLGKVGSRVGCRHSLE